VTLVFVGLALALPVLLALALRVPAAADFVRARALSAVNARLLGRVEATTLTVELPWHVALAGVRVLTPEGAEAATVARLDVSLAPSALLQGRVRLDRVTVTRPDVLLTDSCARPTFARAFEAREPTPGQPAEQDGGFSPVVVEVDALEVRDGRLRLDTTPAARGVDALTVDASLGLGDAVTWRDVRLEAVPVGLPLGPAILTTRGRMVPGRVEVEALALEAGATRLALHGALGLSPLALDVSLDEVTVEPAALGLPLAGSVSVGGTARGPLGALEVALGARTAAGDLALQARVDLGAPVPAWTLALRSAHLAPGAFAAIAPPGLDTALDVWALGDGNPLEQGFALFDVALAPMALANEALGALSAQVAARAGAVDAVLTVTDAAGARASAEAHGALPPSPATLVLDVGGLELAPWGRRLGLDGLRGRVDTAHLALDAVLGPGGIANVVGKVALAGTNVGVAPPAAPQTAAANVRLEGVVRWPGSGSPTGHLVLDLDRASGEGAGLGRARVELNLVRPRGTSDARLRASVGATRLVLPGDRRLDEAAVSLDARMPAEPTPAFDRLAGFVQFQARGLAFPEATLARADGRLDADPEGRRVHLRGPLTLRGLSLPGLISLDSAVARVDARLDPGARDATGEAALAVAGFRAGSFELHTAALSVSRDREGVSRVGLSAERGPLRFDTRLAVVGLTGGSRRLATTLEVLRVDDGSAGVEASPGATIELAANGDLRVAGLALGGTGDLAPSTLEVTGDYLPAARAVDARVALHGVDVARWLRFAERISGQALPTDVEGRLDGTVQVAGTTAAPTLAAALQIHGGRLGALRDASASLDAKVAEGSISLRGAAAWAPSGRFALQVAAPATVSLLHDEARLHLAPDAPVTLRADATDLDLGVLGVEVQGKPLQGRVTAALQLDGPLRHPLAVLGARATALTLGGLDGVDVDTALVLQQDATTVNLQVARAGAVPIRFEADLPLNAATLASLSRDEAIRRLTTTPFSIAMMLKEVRLGTLPFLAARFPELDETTVAGDARVSGTLAAPVAVGSLAVKNVPLGDVTSNLDLSLATDGPRLTLGARLNDGDRPMAAIDVIVPDPGALLVAPSARTALSMPGLRVDLEVPGLPFQRLAEMVPSAEGLLSDLLGPGTVAAAVTIVGAPTGPTVAARATARGSGPRIPGAPEPFARELVLDAGWLPGNARLTAGFSQRRGPNALTVEASAPLDLLALLDGSGPPLDQVPLQATARTSTFDLRGLSSFLPQVFGSSSGRLEIALDVTGTLAKPTVQGHAELRFDELTVAAAGLYEQGVVARIDIAPDLLKLQPLALRSDGGAFDLAVTVAVPSFEPDRISLNGALSLEHFRVLGRDDARAIMTGTITVGGTLAAPVVAGDLTFDDAWLAPDLGGRKLQPVGVPDDVVFVTPDGLEEARLEAGARLRRLAGALVLDLGLHLPARHVRIENAIVDVVPAGDLRLRAQGGPVSVEGRISVVEGTVEFYGKRFTLSDESLVVFPGGAVLDPRLDVAALYDISRVDLEPLGLTTTADSHIRLAVSGTALKPKLDLTSDPAMDQTSIISIMLIGSPVGSGQTGAQEAGVQRQTMNLFVGLATGQLARLMTRDLPLDVFRVEAGEQGLAAARITVGKRLTRDLTVFYEADLGAQPGDNQNEVRVQYRLTRRLQLETYVGDAGRGGLDVLLRWRF